MGDLKFVDPHRERGEREGEGEAYPTGLVLEVASFVADAVLMVAAVQELDLPHNV